MPTWVQAATVGLEITWMILLVVHTGRFTGLLIPIMIFGIGFGGSFLARGRGRDAGVKARPRDVVLLAVITVITLVSVIVWFA